MNEFGSLVEIFKRDKGHHCGYCGSESGSRNDGVWGHVLTVEAYANLLNRGWRRSGKYVYHPVMNDTCCPQYAIRLKANDFKVTKSQKKVIKRMNRFLKYGKQKQDKIEPKEADNGETPANGKVSEIVHVPSNISSDKYKNRDIGIFKTEDVQAPNDKQKIGDCFKPSELEEKSETRVISDSSPVNTMPRMKKAKVIRRENKEKKLLQNKLDRKEEVKRVESKKNCEKSFSDLMRQLYCGDNKHHLIVRTIAVSPRYHSHESYTKLIDEEFEIYEKYENTVHKRDDTLSKQQFTSFLIDTPLKSRTGSSDGNNSHFGTFHQQYRIDDKLVGVSVIDVLKETLTSVYFFYDPDYGFLSLGTFSVLYDIYNVQVMNMVNPMMKYISLGFYVHSCPKMQYKAAFKPSELLCPETYTWHDLEKGKEMLNKNKYTRLAPQELKDEDDQVSFEDIHVFFCREAKPYSSYVEARQQCIDKETVSLEEAKEEDELSLKNAAFFGKCASHQILVYKEEFL